MKLYCEIMKCVIKLKYFEESKCYEILILLFINLFPIFSKIHLCLSVKKAERYTNIIYFILYKSYTKPPRKLTLSNRNIIVKIRVFVWKLCMKTKTHTWIWIFELINLLYLKSVEYYSFLPEIFRLFWNYI